MHLAQPAELRLGGLLGLDRHAGLVDADLVLLDLLGSLVAVAQLLLDGLHLLAQVVFALALVDFPLGLVDDPLLDFDQVELVVQEFADGRQTGFLVDRLEDPLGGLGLERQVGGDQVGQAAGLVEVLGDQQHVGGDALPEGGQLLELLLDRPDEGLHLQARLTLGDRFLDAGDLHPQVGLLVHELVDAPLGDALDEDLDAPVGDLEHAHDQGHDTHPVDVVRVGFLGFRLALRGQEDHPVVPQGFVDGLDRLLPGDEEGQDHRREDDQVPDGDQGQFRRDRQLFLAHRLSSGLSLPEATGIDRLLPRFSWIFGTEILRIPWTYSAEQRLTSMALKNGMMRWKWPKERSMQW